MSHFFLLMFSFLSSGSSQNSKLLNSATGLKKKTIKQQYRSSFYTVCCCDISGIWQSLSICTMVSIGGLWSIFFGGFAQKIILTVFCGGKLEHCGSVVFFWPDFCFLKCSSLKLIPLGGVKVSGRSLSEWKTSYSHFFCCIFIFYCNLMS